MKLKSIMELGFKKGENPDDENLRVGLGCDYKNGTEITMKVAQERQAGLAVWLIFKVFVIYIQHFVDV